MAAYREMTTKKTVTLDKKVLGINLNMINLLKNWVFFFLAYSKSYKSIFEKHLEMIGIKVCPPFKNCGK